MALVFKIKYQDTLRRWLVSEDFNSMTFSLTLGQLEDKIRELFHLSPTASLVITYADKDNDVVTLGDDRDLVDACVGQQLNPLRLDVHEKLRAQEPTTVSSVSSTEDDNVEVNVNPFLPQATADNIRNVVKASTQALNSAGLLDVEVNVNPFLPQTTADNIRNVVKASTQALNSAGLLAGNFNRGLVAGGLPDLGLGNIIPPVVLPHAPVLPNLRARDVHHVFHRGVQCDGCGMNPIEGPRYKSTKVPNCDLCFSCYDRMGTESDFDKLEHPINPPFHDHAHSFFLKRGSRPPAGLSWGPSTGTWGPYGWMPECPFSGQAMDFFPFDGHCKKLDARFVKDVTVLDGTVLGPGTRFTKIWHMANNGTLPWPQGTKFMHIGGDTLSSIEMVNLELPDGGLPCGEDVEISVDLRAPDVVGRYVSYWRLLSPLGQRFGHRVWVVIQVISQLDGSTKEDESFVDVRGKTHDQEVNETNTAPSKLICEKGGSSNIINTHVDGCGIDNDEDKNPEIDPEMDIELDGFSVVEKPVETRQVVSGIERYSPSVKDLLLCAGWEDIIRNLKEMGFNDQATNIRLLHKHNGSIKLVVKDLVKMENQEEGKEAQQM